jgi:hypothetical protein
MAGKKTIVLDQLTSELFKEQTKVHQKRPDKYDRLINKSISNKVSDGLQLGKIVILDSVYTMTSRVTDLIPESAKDSLKISFWLSRNKN